MKRYAKFTDDELIEVYNSMMDYSGRLSLELSQEIESRGGILNFEKLISNKKKLDQEIIRVSAEIYSFTDADIDIAFLKGRIKSDLLTEAELEGLIEQKFAAFKAYRDDKTISKETYISAVIATIAASIVGGILFTLLIFFMPSVFLYFIVPIYMIDYSVIKAITQKTRRNALIFISALIATILSLLIGLHLGGMLLPGI
jgi:VIT1/CCC1 family predicted Fe2+/Mn2+ transporter